jgi:hypothetical protein
MHDMGSKATGFSHYYPARALGACRCRWSIEFEVIVMKDKVKDEVIEKEREDLRKELRDALDALHELAHAAQNILPKETSEVHEQIPLCPHCAERLRDALRYAWNLIP